MRDDPRLDLVKGALWFLSGTALVVLLLRFLHGPGSVSNLTDMLPWGLWKGVGVVALVPIGGAGFTLVMLVHVFGLERFRPLVRGAVLMALICYAGVGAGLTVDIGVWWRIAFPVFHWQFNSVLFEVAWCVMLYLLVLVCELGQPLAERFGWSRLQTLWRRLTPLLAIFGICLSTLHQSSLGTLFLATPFRLHPLWHTDLLPLLFFLSSLSAGCLAISLVAILVHRLYRKKPPMAAIAGLGGMAAWLIALTLALRLGDILLTGKGGLLLGIDLDRLNFGLELLLGSLIPLLLLFRPALRREPRALAWIAGAATAGLLLNRVNVAGLATLSRTGSFYFPAWTEWAVTLGLLAGGGLFYLFMAENFPLFPAIGGRSGEGEPTREGEGPAGLIRSRRLTGKAGFWSFCFILAAALTLGAAPERALFGVTPERTPVRRPRTVAAGPEGGVGRLLIDGDRRGRRALFDHRAHQARNGDRCARCHHATLPGTLAAGCCTCHRDMHLAVDIFDHAGHVRRQGGNQGCRRCHTDPGQVKSRRTARPCLSCHEGMVRRDSLVRTRPGRDLAPAPGYTDAMHGLCIGCHRRRAAADPRLGADFHRCAFCHGAQVGKKRPR